jgi:hypothetical protein
VVGGLAVHYETAITGGGRLAGSEFPALVRAAAIAGALPTLDALSLESPRFPGGNRAYLYGSYAVTRGDTARMGRLVEASSGRLIPWRHDANARDAFGESFTARWAEWRDSVTRELAGLAQAPMSHRPRRSPLRATGSPRASRASLATAPSTWRTMRSTTVSLSH